MRPGSEAVSIVIGVSPAAGGWRSNDPRKQSVKEMRCVACLQDETNSTDKDQKLGSGSQKSAHRWNGSHG